MHEEKVDPIEKDPEYQSLLKEVDEKAYRVAVENVLKESKKSLENIHLNPWLAKDILEEKIKECEDFLSGKKDHIFILGFVHAVWGWKKKILKEEHGINWHTPEELNPGTMYD